MSNGGQGDLGAVSLVDCDCLRIVDGSDLAVRNSHAGYGVIDSHWIRCLRLGLKLSCRSARDFQESIEKNQAEKV